MYPCRVQFSADGKLLAAAGQDRMVRLWDLGTGREVGRLPFATDAKAEARTLAFARDGKVLAVGGHERQAVVELWDPAAGRRLRQVTLPGEAAELVQFAPDGKTLAVGTSSPLVHLLDAETGRPRDTRPGHFGPVDCLALSRDGRVAASAAGDNSFELAHGDQPVHLWDARTDRQLRRLAGHTGKVWGVAFAPDGRLLASAGRVGSAAEHFGLLLWDWAAGRQVRAWDAGTAWIRGAAFAPDGRAVAAVAGDAGARRWEVATGKELPRRPGVRGEWAAATRSPDGRFVAAAGTDHVIRVREAASGKELYHSP